MRTVGEIMEEIKKARGHRHIRVMNEDQAVKSYNRLVELGKIKREPIKYCAEVFHLYGTEKEAVQYIDSLHASIHDVYRL